jgi:hypothetical protein
MTPRARIPTTIVVFLLLGCWVTAIDSVPTAPQQDLPACARASLQADVGSHGFESGGHSPAS